MQNRVHNLQDSSIVNWSLPRTERSNRVSCVPPCNNPPNPNQNNSTRNNGNPKMPLMFTLHIFQTYLIQHVQLLLRRPAVFRKSRVSGKKLEKFFAPSPTFPLESTQKTKKTSKLFFHLVISWLSRKKKQPPLLRRETVARCELDRFAHGQVAGALFQGHVFEMPLISLTKHRWQLTTVTARERKNQVKQGFLLIWKNISTNKNVTWRWKCENDASHQKSILFLKDGHYSKFFDIKHLKLRNVLMPRICLKRWQSYQKRWPKVPRHWQFADANNPRVPLFDSFMFFQQTSKSKSIYNININI